MNSAGISFLPSKEAAIVNPFRAPCLSICQRVSMLRELRQRREFFALP